MPIRVTADTAASVIQPRRRDTHKGDYGRVLAVSGSRKYVGAPFFAASAAVNTGSGLVFLAHPEGIHSILAGKMNEVIFLPQEQDESGQISARAAEKLCDDLSKYDVCVAGPGLGRGAGTRRVLRGLIMNARCPLVLDADCLNELSEDVSLLLRAKAPVIITPHEGEFRRLCPEFSHDRREENAVRFSEKYGCITVLKGCDTLTALPGGEVFVNTTGNPGMAKGGSGDVLSGIIASLLGQGIEPGAAAYIGVWLHGRAGDICAERLGEYGMTPTDMLGDIRCALSQVVR